MVGCAKGSNLITQYVSSLFMYLDRYNCNIVLILCLGFFVAWLFVCTVFETDQYHAST